MAKKAPTKSNSGIKAKIKSLFARKKGKTGKVQPKTAAKGGFSRLKDRTSSWLKKYVPSLMILFSGSTASGAV